MGFIETKIKEIDNFEVHSASKSIYDILKSIIYKGYTITHIDNMCSKLNIYSIINFLLMYGEDDPIILNAIKDYYENLKIHSQKCLIISDTHIGRILPGENRKQAFYKNEEGLYSAYNYAIKHNINYVIHLGDLIEGKSHEEQESLDINQQLNYLERIYPQVDSIKTFLLYGNHDFNAIMHNKVEFDFYKRCYKTKLIGVNYSYIQFCGQTIKLEHFCKEANHLKNIELPYDFELSGHSHNTFNIYEDTRTLKIPALTIDQASSDNGFLELTDEENGYLFKRFDRKANSMSEKVLTKKH